MVDGSSCVPTAAFPTMTTTFFSDAESLARDATRFSTDSASGAEVTWTIHEDAPSSSAGLGSSDVDGSTTSLSSSPP